MISDIENDAQRRALAGSAFVNSHKRSPSSRTERRTTDSSDIRLMLCQTEFFPDQHHGKFGIRFEVAPREAPRRLSDPEHPFAAGPLEKARRPRHSASEHVESGPDADQHRRFQCWAMRGHPT